MRRHVATEHPTVCLDMDDRVWRNETETLREVPASFPTPPGYVPYREEDLQQPFPFPFVYILTPKDLCPRAPDSRPDQAAEATEAAAAAVGASPAQEVSDWEDMGVEIVIEEEATEDGPPILWQQRVVSVQPVDDEIPGLNDTRTIQCAARDLLATAGLEKHTRGGRAATRPASMPAGLDEEGAGCPRTCHPIPVSSHGGFLEEEAEDVW